MDRATATAIKKANARVDTLEKEVRNELGVLRGEMRAGFDSIRAEMVPRVTFESAFESLRGELRAQIAESRHHSQMLFESLQDDIRIIADGLAHISARIDRL